MALDEIEAAPDLPLEARQAVDQTGSLAAPQPEPEDVAGVGPGGRGDQHGEQREEAPRREEARQDEDRLALQEGAGEDGQVAVMVEERFEVHASVSSCNRRTVG